MDMKWSNHKLEWDGIAILIMSVTEAQYDSALLIELEDIEAKEELMGMQKVLDAKYEKADINVEVDKIEHLSSEEKLKLTLLLYKCEVLMKSIDLELQKGSKPSMQNPCQYHILIWTHSRKK